MMFQKIQEETKTKAKEETKERLNILTNVISKKYIILYIITFMVSKINLGADMSLAGLAIIVSAISNEIPIIAILGLAFIGNIVRFRCRFNFKFCYNYFNIFRKFLYI